MADQSAGRGLFRFVADGTSALGADASQNPFPADDAAEFKAMVDTWWTLGFVVETTPAGAPKDLYEVEFNVAPPAGPSLRPRTGPKRVRLCRPAP